jgi:hypothetical protein
MAQFPEVARVRFWLFGEPTHAAFAEAWEGLREGR